MKLLLLTSSTGGGHDMRARSFEQWAKELRGEGFDIETFRIQALEETHGIYKFGVFLYNFIQKIWPAFHHVYFNFLETFWMLGNPKWIHGAESFQNKVREIVPDVVISTHAHLNHGFFDLVKLALPEKPPLCVTYCGELFGGYGFSKHWVSPHAADLFIGAVEETCEAAKALGMPEEKILNGGFMLNPSFYSEPLTIAEKEDFIKNRLELDPEKLILVLGTGANGANNHRAYLQELLHSGLSCQVVALCSNNEELLEQMKEWRDPRGRIQLTALAYFNEMKELLQSATAIVARPGTGLTSEAIMSGCFMIFNGNGGVMPQERITLKFAKKHGIGEYCPSSRDLPKMIQKLENLSLEDSRASVLKRKPKNTPPSILKYLKEKVNKL